MAQLRFNAADYEFVPLPSCTGAVHPLDDTTEVCVINDGRRIREMNRLLFPMPAGDRGWFVSSVPEPVVGLTLQTAQLRA
jgi:hypothetical protein